MYAVYGWSYTRHPPVASRRPRLLVFCHHGANICIGYFPAPKPSTAVLLFIRNVLFEPFRTDL